MKSNYYYKIFGFIAESSFPFLDIPQTFISSPEQAQVKIAYGDVPHQLDNCKVSGLRYSANQNEFILRVDNVARYYVAAGEKITIAPEQGAKQAEIMLFLMGSAMGALLFQRQVLPLHGSAVQVGDYGVVFLGTSGAGKSTLAGALQEKGFPLLADDICAIDLDNDGRTMINPGFPRLKLWADTLEKLANDRRGLNRVRQDPEFEKYFYPAQNFACKPVKVGSVFILTPHNRNEFVVNPLHGADKIEPLTNNTFRANYLKGLGSRNEHFRQCSAVAVQSKVYKVTRPQKGFLLEELIEQLAEYW